MKENEQLVVKSTKDNVNIDYPELDKLEGLVKRVKTSLLAKPFYITNEDGDYLYEEDGKTHLVNEGAILTNMLFGHEMGLQPITSLALGPTINKITYFKILRGREMGLDIFESMSSVYVIEKGGNMTAGFGYDIITGKILASGGKIEYLMKAKPIPLYYDMGGKYIGSRLDLFEDDKVVDPYFLYIKNVISAADLKKAFEEGKIPIMQKGFTKATVVRLTRADGQSQTFSYTLIEATNAGLYMGHDSRSGEEVIGKANWNNHPETHLNHRPITIGGRILFADVIKKAYSIDEVQNFDDNSKEVVEASIIEDIKETIKEEVVEEESITIEAFKEKIAEPIKEATINSIVENKPKPKPKSNPKPIIKKETKK